MRYVYALLFACLLSTTTWAQFQVNGSATNLGGNCFRLTDNVMNQVGSVWGTSQMDLSKSFDIYFEPNFGFDTAGGEGMAFVMHQVGAGPSALGTGPAMGYGGISLNLLVEFDTETQGFASDPAFDHIALMRNGNQVHAGTSQILGPFQMSAANANVKDGLAHQVRISWNAATQTFEVYFDCVLRMTYIGDIVTNFFGGNPNVWWGWTGGTRGAGETNIQQLCLTYATPLDALGSHQICSGDSVQLDAVNGANFTWTPAAGLTSSTIQGPIAGPTNSTNYVVQVTDQCGFQRTDTAFITVADTLVALISGDTTFCGGVDSAILQFTLVGQFPMEVVVFNGTNNDTLLLDASGNNALTGQPIKVAPLVPTTYNVLSVAGGSSCIDTIGGSATITPFYNLGITTTSSDALCNGSCDGIGSINVPAGTSYTYNWPNASTLPSNSNLCAGSYRVTVTETNTTCSDTFNITINEPTLISVPQLPDDTLCLGTMGTYSLTPTGGVGGYVYSWSRSNDPTVLSTINSLTITSDSSTNFTAIVTDANNCPSVTRNFTIFVRDSIQASILANPPLGVCAGDPVNLVGNAIGGDGVYTYTWNYIGGPALGQAISDIPGATANYNLIVEDGCGTTPPGSAVIQILVDPIPDTQFLVDDTIVCPGQDVTFSMETFNSNYTYLIEYGDFTNDTLQGGDITHAYTNAGCQDVTVTVLTQFCTVSNPIPCRVDVLQPPIADFSWSPVGVELTKLNPYVDLNDQSFDGITAIWFEDSVRISTELNFTHAFQDSGLYEITLVSVNDSGCTDTISTEIEVVSDFITFYIPNAFSPNGDNANETFGPAANIFVTDNYSFKVYDRWGDKVFETSDLNTTWNGQRFNDGDKLPQGVYVYAIEFFDRGGREQAYRGHITLFR